MARKSTGKRLRFEVFKRDHFTCQYCGAQPPGVVLVVDHIHPVALGGTSDITNLLTACEACNQGKAHKEITDRVIRPDADLLFLEAQQEIAELRRYQIALAEKEAAMSELIEALQELWSSCSGLDWVPSDAVIRELLTLYSPDVAEAALTDVAFKMRSGYVKEKGGRWVGYLHTVARNRANDMEVSE